MLFILILNFLNTAVAYSNQLSIWSHFF